jgi:enolase
MLKIKLIKARKILDSRKKPTIEVLIKINNFFVKASVPSGASTGKYEAKVINSEQAIKNIHQVIVPKLVEKNSINQKEIDKFLIKNKLNLGANATVGISMAICRAAAKAKNLSLYRYISNISGLKINIPKPSFNIINGGVHAKNNLDIQEFMIVPQFKNFFQNFKLAKKIYKKLGKIIKEKFKKIERGDEGGYSPPISKTNEALELIRQASNNFQDIKIILDCAASQFQKGNRYKIDGKFLTKKELIDFYQELILNYPIIGLEDSFGEEDFEGWRKLSSKFKVQNSKLLIIGDDLTVTNSKRIKMIKKKDFCNSVIIKINQIGTLSEAIEAIKLAKLYNWKVIISHRSGETLDNFIADFSVGVGADYIKSGAPIQPERLAKYNRLLEIAIQKC